jgi:hypothetical protein
LIIAQDRYEISNIQERLEILNIVNTTDMIL